MPKAVFFDRDGVINNLVFNADTKEFEAPHKVEDLQLTDNAVELLSRVKGMGFLLFLVSNQPDAAKGKTTLKTIKEIHSRLDNLLRSKVMFSDYFYCYHQSSDGCFCRKPLPYFLNEAIKEYGIDITRSWMVGDQDTDIECGQAAGLSTILIETKESEKKRGKTTPSARANSLEQAINLIGELQ